ncbi:VOC family protein [bacterium]|nr:MAG: VOC family protein [bacterium]
MAHEITIPILPCRSIDENLDFYRVLGFEVTFQQAKPNNYAVVRRGDIELHFFSMKGFEPANSYSTCYILTPEIDQLYQEFLLSLKAAYGRVPSAGIPRVLPLKNKTGRREFIVVDPGGNWIRIGKKSEAPDEDTENLKASSGPLARATHAAMMLERAGHYTEAAEKIDGILADSADEDVVQRVVALVFRAGLAITMHDFPLATRLLLGLRQIPLSDSERGEVLADLERADELEQILLEAGD